MARKMSSVHGNLVSKALSRFHSELGEEDESFADVSSPEEILAQAKVLEPLNRSGNGALTPIFRLENILGHLSDFAAIVALSSGAGPNVTGVVWGSLKVILMLVSQTGDTLNGVLAMLDEISLALPRFRAYEETLPMTDSLESALVDVYTEMTCFCARTIKFFRASPHAFLIRAGWKRLDLDFNQTVRRLRTLSQVVDREADAIRLRTDAKRNSELVEALESLAVTKTSDKLPFYFIPHYISKQFFGREDQLDTIHKNLIDGDKSRINIVLLHGLGGVGKSRLALRYVESHRQEFDAIIWLSADNVVKLEQNLIEVAQRLQLSSNQDGANDASLAVSRVKDWLTDSGCRWLLVFDNVEAAEIVNAILPTRGQGAVLVTSRDATVGFGIATATCHVKPFDSTEGTSALLSLVGRNTTSDPERACAVTITDTLGGLPLAIAQISGFIVQQRLGLADFIPLYERNAAKIDKRTIYHSEDEQTLSTVWEVSLARLPESSSTLQSLLAFLDPDKINESILLDGGPHLDVKEYGFLQDEMDFLDAKEPLLRGSLLHRDTTESSLSVHRLVQAVVIRRLSPDTQTKFLDSAITMLSHGFENTWNKVTSHQFKAWKQCELRVAHVKSLLKQSQRYGLHSTDPTTFAELVFRCAWHLYEKELYPSALEFLEFGLRTLPDTELLMYASACTLRGLIQLDIYQVNNSLQSFLEGLRIRERLLEPNDEFIASSLNAISLAYTELGQLENAVDFGNRAINVRLANNSDRVGNSYSNMASTLLRMGKPDEAEDILKRCPSLKDFADETFLKSGNPRFAGDMILLSRIRQRQGRLDDAIRMASKALVFRQTTHGNHLKTCDSQQLVADMLQCRGDYRSAITFWEQSESVATSLPEGTGYLIRARYKLAECFAASGDDRQSQHWHKAAKAADAGRITATGGPLGSQEVSSEYEPLIPWMLW